MKWKELYENALASWCVVLGGAFLMVYIERGPKGRYVITGKESAKISYYPISNPNDVHVMTFDEDTANTGLYRYLNVGDTVTGASRKFSAPVVKSTSTGVRPAVNYYVIETVNGRPVRELPNVANHAELLRKMNQKQK